MTTKAAIVGLSLAAAGLAYTRTTSARAMAGTLKEVGPSKELSERLGHYFVVDVREPQERVETGFVPSSVNIPLGGIVDGSSTVPQEKPLLLVCRSGARSRKAGNTLLERGYSDVTNLEGGTLAWIAAGLPVEKVKN